MGSVRRGAPRVVYRVQQFFRSVTASGVKLGPADYAQAHSALPVAAWDLFDRMPRPDQRHSLQVMRTLRARGYHHSALLQAALLHDCAKREGPVRLWHRVAMVLIRAIRPAAVERWAAFPARGTAGWQRAFRAYASHPARGADLAAACGCDPLAVELIRYHQRVEKAPAGEPSFEALLAALYAADDDN